MTADQASILAAGLGHGRLHAYVKSGRIVFTGGQSDHSLDIAASTEARVRAHWDGYVENNAKFLASSAAIERLRARVEREAKRLRDKEWSLPDAMRAARVKAAFDTFDDVYWRLEAVPDEDLYDDSHIDDPQEKKNLWNRIESEGVWGIKSSWRLSEDPVYDPPSSKHHGKLIMSAKWEEADATWGFVGDEWKDSGYDTDLRRAAMHAFLEAAGAIPLTQVPEDALADFWFAVEIARFATRSDAAVQEADAKGIILLSVGGAVPKSSSVPPPIVPTRAPHFASKHTFQIRQDVYAGWNVLRFEQPPFGPAQVERMTSQLEPRKEALNVAKSYALDLAQRMQPNPNAIRVLDEQGVCVYAVKSTAAGPLEVPCPPSDLDRPAVPRQYNPRSNPLSRNAQTAITISLVLGGFGAVVWLLRRHYNAPVASASIPSTPSALPKHTSNDCRPDDWLSGAWQALDSDIVTLQHGKLYWFEVFDRNGTLSQATIRNVLTAGGWNIRTGPTSRPGFLTKLEWVVTAFWTGPTTTTARYTDLTNLGLETNYGSFYLCIYS